MLYIGFWFLNSAYMFNISLLLSIPLNVTYKIKILTSLHGLSIASSSIAI